MKTETLQKRIEKNLFTKGGNLAKKYEDALKLLKDPNLTLRPAVWKKSGRHFNLSDNSYNIEMALMMLGINYTVGNDAPRGGKDGKYIRLTNAGKKQVKAWARENK